MPRPPNEAAIVARITQWAQTQDTVRAVLLTSSLVNPHARVDVLSDYDVILYVTDTQPYVNDERWMEDFGRILVRFRDTFANNGTPFYTRLLLYADGTKIDFTLAPLELLRHILAASELPPSLDIGYRVLLDKDGLTAHLKPPTYRAHIPSKPTAAEFFALTEEFWWETTYVAKNLWRDELMPAKFSFDTVIKFELLQRLLEWYVEIEHNGSLKPGAHGRLLKSHLPPAIWAEFETTFAGASIEENWQALFASTTLFHKIALTVAQHLGYDYAQDLEDGVLAYLRHIQALKRET